MKSYVTCFLPGPKITLIIESLAMFEFGAIIFFKWHLFIRVAYWRHLKPDKGFEIERKYQKDHQLDGCSWEGGGSPAVQGIDGVGYPLNPSHQLRRVSLLIPGGESVVPKGSCWWKGKGTALQERRIVVQLRVLCDEDLSQRIWPRWYIYISLYHEIPLILLARMNVVSGW